MKIFYTLLILSNFTFAQTWSQLSDLPALERDDGVAKVINNKAYFGTGLRVGFSLGNDFYSLDLTTNTWTTIASMPNGAERQYAVAFTYSNYFFVQGGSGAGGALFSDTYRYDVVNNIWTTVAPKPGTAVMASSSFTLNNKAYVFSGKDLNNTVSNEVWEYDMMSNVWTQKNNFPFGGRWRASAATLNNNGYVMFGRDNNNSIRKEIYKYNQSADSWTKITDFPQAKGRYYVGMQNAANKLVLFGGIDTLDNYFNDCWFFDDITNSFSQGPNLPSFGRKGGMCCSSGNKFYYSCGVTATARVKETWMIDVPVGIKEYLTENNFIVGPNPCSGVLYIKSLNKTKCKIEFGNLIGETLFEKYFNSNVDENINLAGLAKGVYILKFIIENKASETRKIIVE